MVAAMLAPLVPETRAVLLFSSGGGSDFGAEVKASMAYQMRAAGAPESAVAERSESTEREWSEIRANPVPDKEWASDGKLARNTYLWWSSA